MQNDAPDLSTTKQQHFESGAESRAHRLCNLKSAGTSVRYRKNLFEELGFEELGFEELGFEETRTGSQLAPGYRFQHKDNSMTAQKGKDLLVKIASGGGFTTVAGLRTRRLAFNAEAIDITHAESANRWRELLEGAGVKRASVSGRGLFKDVASDALMRQAFFDGSIINHQIVIPDFGTVQGPFQITSLEIAGEHNGEVTYDMSLESAGELTFTGA